MILLPDVTTLAHADFIAVLMGMQFSHAGIRLSRPNLLDGLFRKIFELRNFVLEAPPEKESDPLWVTLTPVGLANLDLDVALSISNFRTRATVANFDADMRVRGNLRLNSTLRLLERPLR